MPEPPKWPNVRGEVRVPVQWPALSSLSSKPSPQSIGSNRPKSGSTPARPGNATAVASASVSRATSVGASSSRASATASASVPCDARGRRAAKLRAHPERLEARPRRGTARTASRRAPRRARRAPRSPGSSRSAAARPARSAGRRRTAARSRARAGAGPSIPAGPAGSSRSTDPLLHRDERRERGRELRHRRPAEDVVLRRRAARRRRRAARRPRRRAPRPTRRSGEALPRRGDTSVVERRLIPGHSPYEPVVGYSRAVVDGGHVYVSGTAPIPREGDPPEGAYEQARLCLEIVGGALGRQAPASPDVVRTRIYLDRRGRLGGGRARARRGVLGDPARDDRRRRQGPARPALAGRDRGRGVLRGPMKQIYPPSITGKGAVARAAASSTTSSAQSDPYTLGVEEEYMLLDGETFDLVQHIDTVLAGDHGPRARAADQRRADAVGARDRDARLPKRGRRPARAAEAPRLRDGGRAARRASASARPARIRSASSSASGSRRATATATSSTSSSTSRAAS